MNFLTRSLFGSGVDEDPSPSKGESSHMGELPNRHRQEEQFNVLVIDHTKRGERDWASFFAEAATTPKPVDVPYVSKEGEDGGVAEALANYGGPQDDEEEEESQEVAEAAKLVRGQGLPVTFAGEPRLLCVFQGGWEDVSITSYGSVRKGNSVLSAQCELALGKNNSVPGSTIQLGSSVSFRVDFVLIRNQVVGALPDQDFRNQLYALMHANVPSCNSLTSIYMFIERVVPFAELQRLRQDLGADVFPVIEQTFYPTHREMLITPSYPLVVKTGHAHAGFGKMRLTNHHDFADLRGLIAMTKFGCSAEPFLDGEYELRVQKIGEHVRVMRRIGMSGSWKTNTGAAIMQDVEVTDQHRLWAEQCGEMFGGLDILAVDALHTADGKDYILEVNDTSIGLGPSHHNEDSVRICRVSLERMADAVRAKTKVERSRGDDNGEELKEEKSTSEE